MQVATLTDHDKQIYLNKSGPPFNQEVDQYGLCFKKNVQRLNSSSLHGHQSCPGKLPRGP